MGDAESSSNIGRDKSFADDLNRQQGIVSMRVALCHDLLRLSLCCGDLSSLLFLLLPFSSPILVSFFGLAFSPLEGLTFSGVQNDPEFHQVPMVSAAPLGSPKVGGNGPSAGQGNLGIREALLRARYLVLYGRQVSLAAGRAGRRPPPTLATGPRRAHHP